MRSAIEKNVMLCWILLCISIIALTISILYNSEKLIVFWMISLGPNIGFLIGYKIRYKVSIKMFLRILLLAVISISLSLLLYAILKDSSLIYVLLLNGCALAYSIVLLRRQKRNSSELPEN